MKEAKFVAMCLQALKVKTLEDVSWAKEWKQPLNAGKAKEIAFLLESPEGTYLCQNLDFSQAKFISDSWSLEL